MRLVLDLQCTQSPAHADRGIARYAVELAAALHRGGADLALLTLNPSLPFPRSLPPDLLAHPGLGWASPRAYDNLEGELAHLILSPMEEVPPEAVLPPHIRACGAHVVAVLFDLIPLVLREHYFSGGVWARYRQRLELYRQADLVLAISEHSRRDALAHLGLAEGRVVSVLGGVSNFFTPRPAHERTRASGLVPGLVRPPVLSVGGGDGRKNLDGLIRAWALVPKHVRARHQLVVACSLSAPAMHHLRVLGAEAGLAEDEMVLTGYVSDGTLRELYRDAALFVFPSTYEGLGLPVLEALACGCPAVTSDRSSLPEILELPASTFDPDDPADMADRITAGLTDDGLRAAISTRGAQRLTRFTWDATAQRVLNALPRLPVPAASERRRPLRTRRIALASPLPPWSSGMAVMAGRLLPELARHVEVVALDPSAHRDHVVPVGVRVAPLRALGRSLAPEGFDHLVAVVGDEAGHWPTVEAVRRHGGTVWLHQARLPALGTERARLLGLPGAWVAERDEELHPGRHLRLDDASWRDPALLSGLGVGLTGLVVRWASGCIVTSELARRLVALDQQPGQAVPPTAVLPLAYPDPSTIGDLEPDYPPLLLAPGHLGKDDGPDALVEALARLRLEVPVRLAFIGPAPQSRRRRVEALAQAYGVEGAVEVVGMVDDVTWWRWVRRASIGVLLRRSTSGETSSAGRDLLAAGVPCITSMASAIELPPGSVVRVSPSVGALGLADLLGRLLADPARCGALASGGRAAAAGWTYADLAAALLPTLDALADGIALHPFGTPAVSPMPLAAEPGSADLVRHGRAPSAGAPGS